MKRLIAIVLLLWASPAWAAIHVPIHFLEEWSGDQPDSVIAEVYVNGPGDAPDRVKLTSAGSLRWYGDSVVVADGALSIDVVYYSIWASDGDTAVDIVSIAPDSTVSARTLKALPDAPPGAAYGLLRVHPSSTDSGRVYFTTSGVSVPVVSLGANAINSNTVTAGAITWGNELDTTGWGLKIDNRPAIGDTNQADLTTQLAADVDTNLYSIADIITEVRDADGDSNTVFRDSVLNAIEDANKENFKADTNQAWASVADVSALGICAFGNGTKPLELYVIDTSGTDDSLVSVSVFALDGSSIIAASDITTEPGVCTLYVEPSTTYTVVVRVNGYHFDAQSITTSAGTSVQSEDLKGYNISLTATPASHQTTLVGQCLALNGNTLSGCKVTIALTGSTMFYSSTNMYPQVSAIVYSDANGDWTATIVGTDSLNAYLPSGSNVATYTVIYEHPSLQPEGRREVSGLSISANGSTTELRDVLAQ